MIQANLNAVAAYLGAELRGETVEFAGLSIDSRNIAPGNLYVAIVGERLDGHQFIAQAVANGAVAVVVSQPTEVAIPQIIVTDTTLALGQIAKYWREQFVIPFIGITGSCGKTTTTQMTGAILSQLGPTLVPQGNLNNQFGVPLTLCRLSAEHQYAVIEMGANRPGDIKYLASIVQPDVSILTNVAPVHLEVSEGIGFGTIDGVFQEKSEIFKALTDGTAIVCADDAYFPQWQKLLVNQAQLSFGLSEQADVHATNLKANAEMQYHFELHSPDGECAIQLSSLGRHNVVNALAAAAAALALKVPLTSIQQGLANVPVVARRMIKHTTKSGATLIDDSYNSNLRSAKAVLAMLSEQPGTKIAILADMLEMGEASEAGHREVGECAKQLGIDYLFTLGEASKATAAAYGPNAQHFSEHQALIDAVQPLLNPNVTVIVKGSLGMQMDRVVQGLG